MGLHDEPVRFRRISVCDHGSDKTECVREPRDRGVLPLRSLGDCIDLDNNPQNPEIEARRYHTFIVVNEWTHATLQDTTVTPDFSVTVALTGRNPSCEGASGITITIICPSEKCAKNPFSNLSSRVGGGSMNLNRTETSLHTLPCAW